MAFKQQRGTKLRQRNIIRRRVGLSPLKPRRGITFVGTARKPKPKSTRPPSPQAILTKAAKIALRGVRKHFGG